MLVASNRGPVSYQFGADGALTGRRGGGGLVAGVTEGLAAMTPEAEVTWICAALSDADRVAARQPAGRSTARNPATSRSGCWTSRRTPSTGPTTTWPTPSLWFVQHLLFDTPNQPQFGREFRRDWAAYLAYNEAFADAMADEAAAVAALGQRPCADPGLPPHPGAPDAAGQLGGARTDAGIAHFSHTPWAPPDYYRMLPDGVGGPCSTACSARTTSASTPTGGPTRSSTAARPSWARR